MNETLDLFRGRALKIARQYDTDHMTFADLTGMADDYAAAFHEALGNSPDEIRQQAATRLQEKLLQDSNASGHSTKISEALLELAASLNRIPIY